MFSVADNRNLNVICPMCFNTLNPGGQCMFCNVRVDLMSNPEPALPARKILHKHYFIGKVLGQGGFGITYKAYDLRTSQTVAIKEFFPKGYATRSIHSPSVAVSEAHMPAFRHWMKAFVKESTILKSVKGLHGVVRMREFFQENETAYIVTDFLDGVSLRVYINSLGGRLKLKDALSVLRPVFDSLYILHENGVIHKDISPENIMVVKNHTVKLIDFGAASVFSDPIDKPFVVLKQGYSPIELYTENAPKGPYSDVYQAGATLYNALTGTIPPEAPQRLKEDMLKKPISFGVRLAPIVEKAIMKSLRVNPFERYQCMLPFIQTLYGEVIPKFF